MSTVLRRIQIAALGKAPFSFLGGIRWSDMRMSIERRPDVSDSRSFHKSHVDARLPDPLTATEELHDNSGNPKRWTGASHEQADFAHIRILRRSDIRPPLVCVFPGPPGARDLTESLPESQAVYEFYWPNIDGQSDFPTAEELAVTFIRELIRVQPHGPYQLCGYSYGGLVAYEMARLLLAQGRNVSFVALFDTWRPGFLQDQPASQRIRYKAARIAGRLRTYRRLLVEHDLASFLTSAFEAITRRIKTVGWRAFRSVFKTARRPVPKAIQEVAARISLRSYTPKPYPGRFVLIRPTDLFERMLRDQTVGWDLCATAGVDVHFVAANHGTMVRKPDVCKLVEVITPYLADATPEGGPIDH